VPGKRALVRIPTYGTGHFLGPFSGPKNGPIFWFQKPKKNNICFRPGLGPQLDFVKPVLPFRAPITNLPSFPAPSIPLSSTFCFCCGFSLGVWVCLRCFDFDHAPKHVRDCEQFRHARFCSEPNVPCMAHTRAKRFRFSNQSLFSGCCSVQPSDHGFCSPIQEGIFRCRAEAFPPIPAYSHFATAARKSPLLTYMPPQAMFKYFGIIWLSALLDRRSLWILFVASCSLDWVADASPSSSRTMW
jgi:hypothetical protein